MSEGPNNVWGGSEGVGGGRDEDDACMHRGRMQLSVELALVKLEEGGRTM